MVVTYNERFQTHKQNIYYKINTFEKRTFEIIISKLLTKHKCKHYFKKFLC